MTDQHNQSIAWPDPTLKAHAIEQAKRLRSQAANAGLKFEAYLPPGLALWLLDLIEQGRFLDPAEAAFVLMGEARQWEPHADLRDELLKRSIRAVAEEARSNVPLEVLMDDLRKMLQQPHAEPAMWKK